MRLQTKFQKRKLKIIIYPIQPSAIIENFSDEVSGLVLSTGGGRNGILFGPAMGYIAAEMILSKKSSVDTSFLNLKRFNN